MRECVLTQLRLGVWRCQNQTNRNQKHCYGFSEHLLKESCFCSNNKKQVLNEEDCTSVHRQQQEGSAAELNFHPSLQFGKVRRRQADTLLGMQDFTFPPYQMTGLHGKLEKVFREGKNSASWSKTQAYSGLCLRPIISTRWFSHI